MTGTGRAKIGIRHLGSRKASFGERWNSGKRGAKQSSVLNSKI